MSSSVVNLIDLAAAALTSTVAASRPIREFSTLGSGGDEDKKHARPKQDGSVVTDADLAAQGLIVRALQQVPGDYRIVGEESQEEMERHLKEETEDEARERKLLFRLAQRELYSRFNGEEMEVPPLSSQFSLGETDDGDDTIDVAILGDEKTRPEYLVDAARVSVFIDPLDGTKSYARGDYETVTVLVAIILDNLPYFGIITKPFDYKGHSSILDTGCVSVYGGKLINGVFMAGGAECRPTKKHKGLPRAVISSSRSEGIVSDFVSHLASEEVVHPEPILVSGAGEKSLRLVLGTENETLWFFPKPGTSRWDVAASDAILRTLGGTVVDKFGKELDYSISRNEAENNDGIIACNDASLLEDCIKLLQDERWKDR